MSPHTLLLHLDDTHARVINNVMTCISYLVSLRAFMPTMKIAYATNIFTIGLTTR